MTLTEMLLVTFAAALVTDLATGLGVLPHFVLRGVSRRREGELTAAAAGMMAGACVMLAHEGLSRGAGPLGWELVAGLVGGAGFFALASRWVRSNEAFDVGKLRAEGGSTALLVVAAMTIHSLPEGVAVGVSFGAAHADGSLSFGWLMAAAIAVHNVPEGLAIATALRATGVGLWKCVWWAVFSSLPQPLAAVPAAWMVWLFEPVLPFGLGFAAGAMLWLVLFDLLPEARERLGVRRLAGGFAVGAGVMTLLMVALDGTVRG